MNESYQKAWDEFMKSDEFANAVLGGSFAPPEYLKAVMKLTDIIPDCECFERSRRVNTLSFLEEPSIPAGPQTTEMTSRTRPQLV